MPSDRVFEPWRSFLAEIDAATPRPLELHCIGGFAVTMHDELVRATGALDVFDVIPNHAALWFASLAGEGSALTKGTSSTSRLGAWLLRRAQTLCL